MNWKKFLKRFIQIFLIVGFLLVTGFLVWLLNATKPEAKEKPVEVRRPLVETRPVLLESVEMTVDSQGTVQSKKRTQLASEISGKVNWVSDNFVVGGQFEEGQPILKIESAPYEASLAEAQATLTDAEVNLANEKARAEQARRDWARLGKGKPSELTLRIPQIKGAEARLKAATAAVKRAQLDLDRTEVKAPFDATVASKGTEIGNYLSPASPIGELFQTSPLEIRLPLAVDDVRFLATAEDGGILGDVSLSTTLGSRSVTWNAKVDRTEGEVDQASRSIYLVSDIFPDEETGNPLRLQPGLFLDASVQGRTFDRVAKVPSTAFLDLSRVVLVNEKQELEFREVEVLRRRKDLVYVSAGLKEGEILCLTELATMIEGTKVDTRRSSGEKQELIDRDVR